MGLFEMRAKSISNLLLKWYTCTVWKGPMPQYLPISLGVAPLISIQNFYMQVIELPLPRSGEQHEGVEDRLY